MGNCNCINQEGEKPFTVSIDSGSMKPRPKASQQAPADVSAASIDYQSPATKVQDPYLDSEPAQKDYVPESKIRQEPPLASRPAPTYKEVVFIQTAIRGFLSRRVTTRETRQWVEFVDPPDTQAESSSDTRLDPMSLLSVPAKATLSQLSPFEYPFSIQSVENYQAKALSDGSIYIGQWGRRANGLFRKGKGKFFSIDGAYFEGYWSGGRLHNLGRIIYATGDLYEGGFDLGDRSGQGSYETFGKKLVYKGSWVKNEKNGHGEEKFADGSHYTGAYRNGEKDGAGEFVWSDGSWYKGSFLNGELNGHGYYAWKDGRTYDGEWRLGKMNGKGKFSYSDGKVYEGQYVNDKKEGFGIYHWEGKVYEGGWLAGKMHGEGYLTTEKGKRKYEFKEGNRVREIKE